MKRLNYCFRWMVELQSWIALALLAAAILLNAYEIFQRNFLGKSFIWLQETSTLMLLWFTMLGMSRIVCENEDICVELFIRRLPATAQRAVRVLVLILVTLFLAVGVRYTWALFVSQRGTTSIVAAYPLQLRSAAILISFATMGIQNLSLLAASAAELLGKKDRRGAV